MTSSLIRLTSKDRMLQYLLTQMGVVVFPDQLAWFWECPINQATKRLRKLTAVDVLATVEVAVRVAPLFLKPRLVWRVGDPFPNVERASYASRKEWFGCATLGRTGYIASRRTLAAAGVRKRISGKKLGHDAAVTQVAMVYVRKRADEWRQFRHESVAHSFRIGTTMPDAVLVDEETAAVTRAIEVCSGYRADTLRRKVEACYDAGIEIEVWG